MWISRREIARLERELKSALQRASDAEERLQSERSSKDWMIQQLTSRVVTKHGGYGLDSEKPQPAPAHPKGFIREEEPSDIARLEYYKKNCRDAGRDEEEAITIYEAEMRGESPAYPYEQEELIG